MGDREATKGMTSPTVPKAEEHGEHSSGSVDSTPEAEPVEQETPQTQEPGQQQQKRKGGRKPIYATSEERKQRNRQAQAAFRERRTEYIKQLESTIKIHEENLQNLQQSHRSAADECLMLRYKNSLLERILLEKGIDVQAELRAKGGSPNLGPIRPPVSAAPLTQPIQRYAVNKYAQNRRSLGSVPKAGSPTQPTNISPNIQPTPTSRISSPAISTHRSPNFLPQPNGPISPAFGPGGQQQIRPQPQQLRPQFNPPPPRPQLATTGYPSSASTINSAASGASAASNSGPNANHAQNSNSFYTSPFQAHYDQLEQEYEQADDMYEDQDSNDQSAGAGAYPNSFAMPGPNMPQSHPSANQTPQMSTNGHHPLQPQPTQHTDATAQFGGAAMNTGYDPYDPMLDADPFGLSASMHFPTQFSFDTTSR
ncbi:uncharacterized protein PV09_02747 [Verruconis gallopava]|uniref:BZIP domain-containing protein n=1 Tax=Verruconis gallopava TaxID=253628 RepID=A0A0D1XU25_9PEZI|nr:uncharacterized protein PV09_02747 [Verruconis gallopava]KIW06276.1 hypothetical protein PV09_02747 [Verruconis gallopava]